MEGCRIVIILFVISSVDSYYIRSVVPSLIYGKNNLLIQCMQQNLQRKDSIYKITLSKIVNGIPRALLAVESDTNSPPAFLKVIWFDSLLQSRSDARQSSLVPSYTAKLVLLINAAKVSCNDDGIYKCDILLSADRSGSDTASLNITIPESIVDILDDSNRPISGKIINSKSNSTVTLKCMALLSVPACLQWCINRQTDLGLTMTEKYDTNDLVFSKLQYNGCHFKRYSVIRYKVIEEDSYTELSCQLASKECNESNHDKGYVVVRNSQHVRLVVFDIPEFILYRRQSLHIRCNSDSLHAKDKIHSITLSKQLSTSAKMLVRGVYNYKQSRTDVIWHDKTLEERAHLTTVEVDPSVSAELHIQIQSSKLQCWDTGTYRCEIHLVSGIYSVEEKTVKVITSKEFVRGITNSPITLGIDNMEISCITSYFDEEDTVNKIVLSKVNQAKISKLVTLELSVSNNGFHTVWRWSDKKFQARVGKPSGSIHPAHLSRLNIQIWRSNVQCSDSGIYICDVFGSNGKSSRSETKMNIEGATATETQVKQSTPFPIVERKCLKSKGKYNVMQKALLRCSGVVGNPPVMPHWCRRMNSNSSFKLYTNNNHIFHGGLKPTDCQYRITSNLEYTVTKKDVTTDFVCMVSSTPCDHRLLINMYRITAIKDTDGSNSSTNDKHCYQEKITEKNKGCKAINGYIAAVIFLSILCLMCVSVVLKMYIQKNHITRESIRQRFVAIHNRYIRRNVSEQEQRVNRGNDNAIFYGQMDANPQPVQQRANIIRDENLPDYNQRNRREHRIHRVTQNGRVIDRINDGINNDDNFGLNDIHFNVQPENAFRARVPRDDIHRDRNLHNNNHRNRRDFHAEHQYQAQVPHENIIRAGNVHDHYRRERDAYVQPTNEIRAQIPLENSINTENMTEECAICYDNICDRVFLPCCHTFCQSCEESLFGATEAQGPTCPLCRQRVLEVDYIFLPPRNRSTNLIR